MTSALGRPWGWDLPSSPEVHPKLPLGLPRPGQRKPASVLSLPLNLQGRPEGAGPLGPSLHSGSSGVILDEMSIYRVPGVCSACWAQETQQ